MKALAAEISDSRDALFAQAIIAAWYWSFQGDIDKLTKILDEIEEVNKKLKDTLLEFILYAGNIWKYDRDFFNPEILQTNIELMEEFFQRPLEFDDDWENNYLKSAYRTSYPRIHEGKTQDKVRTNIEFYEEGLKALSKLGEQGNDLSNTMVDYAGHYYFQLGEYEKAEEMYLACHRVAVKYDSAWQPHSFSILAGYHQIKGNMEQAYKYLDEALEIAKKKNLTLWIAYVLSQRAHNLSYEGKYEEAVQTELESIKYSEQLNQPLNLLQGYVSLFHLHYDKYRVEKNDLYIERAKESLQTMKTIYCQHPEIKLIEYLIDRSEALLLKHGTFKNKAQAMDLFEKQLKHDPNNYTILINLLDLLFENLLISDDKLILERMEELMQKLEALAIRITATTVFHFLSREILIARYYYYLKGDVNRAVTTLTEVKEQMNKLGQVRFQNIIDQELTRLYQEKSKWEALDTPLREKIETSEFRIYLQDALDLVKYQG
jgi:tetratricopeptide (TPR) repeat protein